MSADFLHNHKEFPELIRIVADKTDITAVLVEKDYWIMHCLYGLQRLGMRFELKGGTSLSKGFGIIKRFSEDIDIRIEPPEKMNVAVGRNQDKDKHVESRRQFYEWLKDTIKIDGIREVARDSAFDDKKQLRSAGIRLHYPEVTGMKSDLKEGVLLEVGFDDVAPNVAKDISSWAYDHAAGVVEIIDNRAKCVGCYSPAYTLVEKLQTISTKFRRQQAEKEFPLNFLRHYYDVYCLLGEDSVKEFIGTDGYHEHKKKRFRSENPDLTSNEAFLFSDPEVRGLYAKQYDGSQSLYYSGRPSFDEILKRIGEFADAL